MLVMEKEDIKNGIINVFGDSLVLGKDYLDITKDDFVNSYEGIESIDSEFFYQAVSGGGYEEQLFGKLAYYLNKGDLVVVRERTLSAKEKDSLYQFDRKGIESYYGLSRLKRIDKKKVDIAAYNDECKEKVGVEVGHCRLFEYSNNHNPKNNDNLLQKAVLESINLTKLETSKNYFIALVTDVDLNGDKGDCRFLGSRWEDFDKRDGLNYVTRLNYYRNNFSAIDKEFVHLVFKSASIAGYGSTVYLNIFILEIGNSNFEYCSGANNMGSRIIRKS